MAGQRIDKCDIAIVGGGLAGGLAALALAAKRPDLDVRLVEPGPIGGNHVWSFFDSDIAKTDRSEEHTSELQSLMRISYAVFCLKKKTKITTTYLTNTHSYKLTHEKRK